MHSDKVLSADNQQGRLQSQLNPWYVSGFVDGEGSFHIAIYRDVRMKSQWKIIPEFHVSQRVSSRAVLDQLVQFFGCGYVKPNHATNKKDLTYVYVVRDRSDLVNKIIPFFSRYCLKTEKAYDFIIFATVVEMMMSGKHRTTDGCREIINKAYTMNGGGKYRRHRYLDEIAKPSETTR